MKPRKPFLLLVLLPACFRPDVEAIQTHLRDECALVPATPVCTDPEESDAAYQVAFERFAQKHVQSPEQESCILAVDCSPERMNVDADGAHRDVERCLAGVFPPDEGVEDADEDLNEGEDGNVDDDVDGDVDDDEGVNEDTDDLVTCLQVCDQTLRACDEGCGDTLALHGCFNAKDTCKRDCAVSNRLR